VYGEANVPGAGKTVIFYAHYDGQPVNPALWAKGLNPFQPQLLNGRVDEDASIQTYVNFPLNDDWRIYARGLRMIKVESWRYLWLLAAIKDQE